MYRINENEMQTSITNPRSSWALHEVKSTGSALDVSTTRRCRRESDA